MKRIIKKQGCLGEKEKTNFYIYIDFLNYLRAYSVRTGVQMMFIVNQALHDWIEKDKSIQEQFEQIQKEGKK